MAATKRISRKSIRQPDAFITITTRFLEYFRKYQTKLLVGAVGLALILSAAAGWSYYRTRQYRKAAQEYGTALSLFYGQKHREAAAAFEQIAGYRTAPYDRLARLYLALSHRSLNDVAAATGALQALIKIEKGDSLLRQIAWENLGYIQASQGHCKEAAASFEQAAHLKGPFQAHALLAKARCNAETGDREAAAKDYKEYLQNYPDSLRSTEVTLLAAELGKIMEPAK